MPTTDKYFWSNQYDQPNFNGFLLYIRKDNVYLDIRGLLKKFDCKRTIHMIPTKLLRCNHGVFLR